MRSICSHSVAPAEVLATVGETGAEPRSRISTRPAPAPSQTRSRAPRLRGSWTSSSSTISPGSAPAAGSGSAAPARTSAAMPLWAAPAISASARSGTTRNGTRWRWQASWISSRRLPARAALTSTRATSCGRWRRASRTG